MDFDDFRSEDPPALLLVVSGSSGAGKDAIIDRMKELRYPFSYVVTATTRAQRTNEIDGVHYHFVTVESFQQMIERGELLEWASVYDNFYGVPRRSVSEAMKKGSDVVVKVDVQGAATIRRAVPGAVLVFIRPPSLRELEHRLRNRRSETAKELAVRLGKAAGEYNQLPLFDYVLTSQQSGIDEAVRQIQAIVAAEKCRVNPRRVEL